MVIELIFPYSIAEGGGNCVPMYSNKCSEIGYCGERHCIIPADHQEERGGPQRLRLDVSATRLPGGLETTLNVLRTYVPFCWCLRTGGRGSRWRSAAAPPSRRWRSRSSSFCGFSSCCVVLRWRRIHLIQLTSRDSCTQFPVLWIRIYFFRIWIWIRKLT